MSVSDAHNQESYLPLGSRDFKGLSVSDNVLAKRSMNSNIVCENENENNNEDETERNTKYS
jgi:hypothetical protein